MASGFVLPRTASLKSASSEKMSVDKAALISSRLLSFDIPESRPSNWLAVAALEALIVVAFGSIFTVLAFRFSVAFLKTFRQFDAKISSTDGN